MTDKTLNPRRMKTGIVRLSFPRLFTPEAMDKDDDDSKKKYSCVLLIKKGDSKVLDPIRQAEKAAIEDEYPGGKNLPKKFRESTLKDGDEEDYDGYEGCFALSCSSTDRPGVITYPGREQITDESRIYAGCFVRASLYFACYDKKGNRGVTAYLNNIQFMADGPRLDSRKSASDDFDDDFEVSADELAALSEGAEAKPGTSRDDDDLTFDDDDDDLNF